MKKRISATDKHPGRAEGEVWSAPSEAAAELIKRGWAREVEDNPEPIKAKPPAPAKPPVGNSGAAEPADNKED